MCLYTGLVDCYLASHRLRDAVTLATRAFSHLGCSARTSTVSGFVLSMLGTGFETDQDMCGKEFVDSG